MQGGGKTEFDFFSFVKEITQEFGQDCFFFSLTEEVQLQKRRDVELQVLCAYMVLKKMQNHSMLAKDLLYLGEKSEP